MTLMCRRQLQRSGCAHSMPPGMKGFPDGFGLDPAAF
jgi:hypothetical protein